MLSSLIDSFRSLSRNARLYLISNSIQAVTAGALAIVYTLYLTALGYDESFIGLVLVVATIGGGIGIVPSQPLVNRFGWRTMLIWSDMIGGVAIFLQLMWPKPPVLLVTSIAIGASVALVLVVNTPFLAANSATRDRTALFGLNNAVQFLASIIGSVLGGVLPGWFAIPLIRDSALLHVFSPLLAADPQARAYQLALLVVGALATPSIIPIFLLDDQARASAGSGIAAVAHPWRERLDSWRVQIQVGVRGVIGRFSLFQALLGFGAGIWFPYFNIYIVKHLGGSTIFYGFLTATATVLLAFASLIAAPLSERFGKAPTIVIAHLCALPFLMIMGAVPVLAVVSIAYLIRSTLANISGPPLQSFLMEAVPERERVIANGVYNVSWQIAWALGAGVGGLIVRPLGPQAPMLVAVPWYGGAALLFAWFFWRRQHIQRPQESAKPQMDASSPTNKRLPTT
jgi:MFS family permease